MYATYNPSGCLATNLFHLVNNVPEIDVLKKYIAEKKSKVVVA